MLQNAFRMCRIAATVAIVVGVAFIAGTALAQGSAEAPEGMVLVPAGDFTMGSPEDDPHAESDEMPQRKINLPAFYIDQFEVSNIDYKRFIEATGYPPPPHWEQGNYAEGLDFYPVYNVSWWEARAFAKWASKRLPTEAEWEKAARGTDGRRFPWGDKFVTELANSREGYVPINAHLDGRSVFGAINMAGNVAEWTSSVYEPYPQLDALLPPEFGGTATAQDNATKPHKLDGPPRKDDPLLEFFSADELRDGRDRVYRGGSFNNYAQFLRTANREHAGPRKRWYNVGFRCAKDVAAAAEAKQ
jgi:formylglycine-generating enzyme required for sulfatase activity